jgi:hypothetical protein
MRGKRECEIDRNGRSAKLFDLSGMPIKYMFREKKVPKRSRKNVVGLKLEVKHVGVFELASIRTYCRTLALTYSTPLQPNQKSERRRLHFLVLGVAIKMVILL